MSDSSSSSSLPGNPFQAAPGWGWGPNRAIAIWLFVCCVMVFVMVVLGGVTRLTDSGLSIVEWKPLMGILPPLSTEEWQETFSKYRNFPEYQKINAGMSLAEFKNIFWLEYFHRLWGRTIGLVFFAPFLVFFLKGQIEKPLLPHLVFAFVLGGLQGVMGWIMVKSGLIDHPDVSHYRLTAHLIIAFIIFGYLLTLALSLLESSRRGIDERAPKEIRTLSLVALCLTLVTVTSGGLVAGLDAGMAFNTFPLMGGSVIPEGVFDMTPAYLNFFDNVALVQFDHRLLAIMTFALCLYLWFRSRRFTLHPRAGYAVNALCLMAVLQVSLGISTLLLYVPLSLAAIHQAGAVVLFGLALWTYFEMKR